MSAERAHDQLGPEAEVGTPSEQRTVTLTYMTWNGAIAERSFPSWDAANRWIPTEDVHYVIHWDERSN